jgi:hypothetical protein
MLPDFRFVFGATLATAMLGVAGFGLVASVRLLHEARVGSLETAQTLAYAGPTEWNQFYDPDSARRFAETAGKADDPGAPARLETPDETPAATAPAIPDEKTASLPADRAEAGVAGDKTADTDPTPALEAAPAGTPAADGSPARAGPAVAPAPDAPATIGDHAAPALDRVASAPATLPASDLREDTQTPAPPQAAGNPVRAAAPPMPRARPKHRSYARIARHRVARTVPAEQPTFQSPGFPLAITPWPGYDNQFSAAPEAKTVAKKSSNSLPGR